MYGDYSQTGDFVYIDDIVQANLLAVVDSKPGTPCNVGISNHLPTQNLIETIHEMVGGTEVIDITHVVDRDSDIEESYAAID